MSEQENEKKLSHLGSILEQSYSHENHTSTHLLDYYKEVKNKGEIPKYVEYAVRDNKLEVLAWFYVNFHTGHLALLITNWAAEYGKLNILNWLCENDIIAHAPSAMNGAARNGHWSVVKRLVQWDNKHNDPVRAMNLAIMNGHYGIVQWLMAETSATAEDITADALYIAAGNGHWEAILELCKEYPEQIRKIQSRRDGETPGGGAK